MNRSEAFQQYQKSYRAGQKYCRACMISGSYPYIRVLDEILDESTLIGRMDLGVMEIPTELIVGTKHAERRLAFAANYMPLLPSDTEFAAKWISLCAAHLSEEGINDPISCYEYMGEFYVQEGAQARERAAQLRARRASPRAWCAWCPRIRTTCACAFTTNSWTFSPSRGSTAWISAARAATQSCSRRWAASPAAPGRTPSARASPPASCALARPSASSTAKKLPVTAAEALLVWLRVYKMPDMKAMMMPDLVKSIESVWADIRLLESDEPIAVETEPPEPTDEAARRGLLTRIIEPLPSHLDVAFVHAFRPGVQPVDHHARHGAPVPGKPAGRRDNRPLLRPGAGPGPGGADGKGRGGGGGRHLQ